MNPYDVTSFDAAEVAMEVLPYLDEETPEQLSDRVMKLFDERGPTEVELDSQDAGMLATLSADAQEEFYYDTKDLSIKDKQKLVQAFETAMGSDVGRTLDYILPL